MGLVDAEGPGVVLIFGGPDKKKIMHVSRRQWELLLLNEPAIGITEGAWEKPGETERDRQRWKERQIRLEKERRKGRNRKRGVEGGTDKCMENGGGMGMEKEIKGRQERKQRARERERGQRKKR